MTISDFLAAFFPDENEPVHLRAFKPKQARDAPNNCALKFVTSRSELTRDRDLQTRLREANKTRGMYFVVNGGGDCDDDIMRFNAWFAEDDSRSIADQHARLDSAPIQPAVRIETHKSVHAYWGVAGSCSAEEWYDVQERLIDFFKSDEKIKNPSRVMRLPFFNHVRLNGNGLEFKRIQLHTFQPERRYTLAEMRTAFPPIPPPKTTETAYAPSSVAFESWDVLHAEVAKRIRASAGARTNRKGWTQAPGVCHGSADGKALYVSPEGAYGCHSNCTTDVIRLALGLPQRPESTDNIESCNGDDNPTASQGYQGPGDASVVSVVDVVVKQQAPWPLLDSKALYGIAGDFVRATEPQTEADPAALLLQFLCAFGNVIGHGPHFTVEADRHYLNLFIALVGETGTGRKGTSWGHVRRYFQAVDEQWARDCLTGGLSSGEGLLYHVRDRVERIKRDKKGTERLEIVDEGVSDKRLLAFEGELAAPLRMQGREGNTLSTMIRNLWDGGTARSLVKNSPIRTTDSHVSIIGHITRHELQLVLSEVESFNGFCNRFLWGCVQRTKFLPRGGSLSSLDKNRTVLHLKSALEFSRTVEEMSLDNEAWSLWDRIYEQLETGRRGLLAKVTQRASPYTLRLACLFALLDCSSVVRRNHLEAAHTLWQYSEDSASYIFGQRTGDPLADDLLIALREADCEGLSRTQIRDLLGRNASSDRVGLALAYLAENGLARSRKDPTPGRSVERWLATQRITAPSYDKNDKRPDETEAEGASVVNVVKTEVKWEEGYLDAGSNFGGLELYESARSGLQD
ncbi:MAG TPA: DUF3987 domain-containing protein [Pyrinomonadaceae bacterium]|nr:DUF3987 domain-containing protein [Pyrinomonadaceae bacterium]